MSRRSNTTKRQGGGDKRAVSRRKTESISKYRKKKEASQNYSGTIVAGLFFLIVFAYLIHSVYAFINKTSIPTVAIQYGSIDAPRITRAIIIRDEKVYKSPAEGTVNYYVKDMDRVKKGAAICSIRNEDALTLLEKDVSQLDKSIMELQARRSDISETQKEVDKINSQIKSITARDIYHFVTMDMRKLYSFKEEVSQTIQIRNQILLSENKGSLKGYTDEKMIYQEEMNQHIKMMYAGESGILSETVDGLENVINFENKETLTKEQTTMSVKMTTEKKEVAVDDDVFKIVLSNEWYIGAYLDNDQIYDYEEGSTSCIYIEQGDDFIPFEVVVKTIVKGENESYILFSSTKNLLDYIGKRSLLIKTTNSVLTGYKIPNSGIVDRVLLKVPSAYVIKEENGNYVMVKNGDLVEKVIITIKDSDEDNEFILQDFSNIKIGDILVKPGDEGAIFQLSEIVSVKGVYIVNSGIAEFRKIDVEGDIPENSGYTILDPSTNQTIKSFDYIVSEAKSIKDGQVIN